MAAHHHHRARFAALLLALSLAGGCGGDRNAPAARSTEGLLVTQGSIDPQLIGVWRMLGEASLVQVSAKGVQQFQEAGSLCYPDLAASTTELGDLEGVRFRAQTGPGATHVDLLELPGAPAAHRLEQIDALPERCRASPPATPAHTFQALCELMARDYPFFVQRKFDWDARCRSLAPRAAAAPDDDALQAVLTEALTGIGDAHVKLYRDQGEQRQQIFSGAQSATLDMLKQAFAAQSEVPDLRSFQLGWRELVLDQMQARLEGGGTSSLNGAMRWGRLPGNVGYIGLHRMLGFSEDPRLATEAALADAAIDQAIAALGSTRAMIVDVSFNGGGSDLISAHLAARFADRTRLAFTRHWYRAEGRPAQPWEVGPAGAARYLKPVYLLTSDLTGSAGETFTLMMRALPHVIHAGQPTMGSISDILEHPLPGRFTLSFSHEIDIDPAGVVWEARGITPVLALPMFDPAAPDTLASGHGAAIDALLARIGSGR